MGRKFLFVLAVITSIGMILMSAVAMPTVTAQGETPTPTDTATPSPTPTATPVNSLIVSTLEGSGQTVIIDMTISAGDFALGVIGIGLLVLLVLILVVLVALLYRK